MTIDTRCLGHRRTRDALLGEHSRMRISRFTQASATSSWRVHVNDKRCRSRSSGNIEREKTRRTKKMASWVFVREKQETKTTTTRKQTCHVDTKTSSCARQFHALYNSYVKLYEEDRALSRHRCISLRIHRDAETQRRRDAETQRTGTSTGCFRGIILTQVVVGSSSQLSFASLFFSLSYHTEQTYMNCSLLFFLVQSLGSTSHSTNQSFLLTFP
jgi:hypothetical protein